MKKMDVNELYDYIAEKFKYDTGFVAPGKDSVLNDYTIDQDLERSRQWNLYNKAFNRGADWVSQ